MKYKITIKYLNIINYPYIEEYLEDMARKGWLLDKIILGSILIFKKIQPQELEFSISPFEIETFFTRKTKKELVEFETVCQAVGWNYCAKSYDLFIYYKEKDADLLEIHTDEEEEFKLLEKIGQKYIKSLYFIIPFLIYLSWKDLKDINTALFYTNGIVQVFTLILPMGLVFTIAELFKMRNFLNFNRKNVELGNPIEYKNPKFNIMNLFSTIFFLSLILFILYIFYTSIFLKNRIISLSTLPVITGSLVGILFRFFIKPKKFSTSSKVLIFIGVLTVSIIMVNSIGFKNMDNLETTIDNPNREKYKLLLISDFPGKKIKEEKEEGKIMQDISLLVPISYKFTSRDLEDWEVESLKTNYGKAINESLAHKLFNAHINETKKSIRWMNTRGLKSPFQTGEYRPYLNITEEDFEELKDKDIKFAIEESIRRIIERNIAKADYTKWNVDDAYYLRQDKTKIVLRKGKEVLVLSGKDFSNMEVIEISKNKLGLE